MDAPIAIREACRDGLQRVVGCLHPIVILGLSRARMLRG